MSIPYPGNFLIPEGGDDYYTYAGEIPWASTFAPDLPDEARERSAINFRDGRSFEVEILNHAYQWESYHSVLNEAGGALVPSRRFCEVYDLRNKPQTFDLFLPDGAQASVSVTAPDGDNGGQLLYLREDLIRAYADDEGRAFVWFVWGERQIVREMWHLDDKLAAIYAKHANVHRRVVSLAELRPQPDGRSTAQRGTFSPPGT
jgi:hypothetical protein